LTTAGVYAHIYPCHINRNALYLYTYIQTHASITFENVFLNAAAQLEELRSLGCMERIAFKNIEKMTKV
jgi:hypothetical protein